MAPDKVRWPLGTLLFLLMIAAPLAVGVKSARGQEAAAGDARGLYLPFVSQSAGIDNPTPADGGRGLSVNAYLAWKFSNPRIQAPRFSILLAANDPAPDQVLATDLQQPLFDPPTFALDTDYYWQVVAVGSDGQRVAGPVWHFHTDDNRQPRDGSAMVAVPAGEFRMGCDLANAGLYGCSAKDTPLHAVWLDAFAVDKYEVTNAQYRACVAAGECKRPRKTGSYERDSYFYDGRYNDFPVLFVSHWDAQDYCGFVGKRLPSEAEWEKAARGAVDTRIFPWGNEFPDCTRANFTEDFYDDNDTYFCDGDTAAVGSHPAGASIYGAMDMAGNVFEWVEDNYRENYYARSPYRNPINRVGDYYSIRGGSYRPRLIYQRVSHRHFGHHGDGVGDDAPYFRNDQVGFRCARSLPK